MKKVSLIKKLLFFLYLTPLNEEIDWDFNYKTRSTITLIFIASLSLFNKYFLDSFINNINIFLRLFIILIYLFIWVEISYLITIKKFNKFKKE